MSLEQEHLKKFKQLKAIWKLCNALIYDIERVVDRLPLMTYGLKLSLEAWILKFNISNLSFKEII